MSSPMSSPHREHNQPGCQVACLWNDEWELAPIACGGRVAWPVRWGDPLATQHSTATPAGGNLADRGLARNAGMGTPCCTHNCRSSAYLRPVHPPRVQRGHGLRRQRGHRSRLAPWLVCAAGLRKRGADSGQHRWETGRLARPPSRWPTRAPDTGNGGPIRTVSNGSNVRGSRRRPRRRITSESANVGVRRGTAGQAGHCSQFAET